MSIVAVDTSNISSNPHCPHGPMIKFTKSVKGSLKQFFSCSACREQRDCPFTLNIDELVSKNRERAVADAKRKISPKRPHAELQDIRQRFLKLKAKNRCFCKTCCEFVFQSELASHESHELMHKVTNQMLSHPTSFLLAKTNDKKEAQYWFDDTTRKFMASIPEELGVDSVVCVGTPSVYEIIRTKGIESLLLDIDWRYMHFYSEEEFGWFNMFNFHFMSNGDAGLKILKKKLNYSRVCVFIDPPFGVRLELLAYTLNRLQAEASGELIVFFALPYFMEPQVTAHLRGFQMLDYVLHYVNHSKMKTHKRSSVRLFTNVPLSTIRLPVDEGYKFCNKCDCWKHSSNAHCDICSTCPGKNATTYKHCYSCGVCVKSTWEHCSDCRWCFLFPHNCSGKVRPQLVHSDKPPRKKRKKTHSLV